MTRDDVELLSRDTAYDGYFRIERYRLRHRLFAGGWSDPLGRELFVRGRVAAVMLYDPDRDAVVMVEQFRIGAFATRRPAWMLEVVAGVVEPGESAEGVARRECREEAGVGVDLIERAYDFLVSPGCSTESVELFWARVDSRTAGGVHGLAHEHEDIRVCVLSLDEALDALRSGRIENGISIVALQWLALNRDRLRSRGAQSTGATLERP